MPASRQRHLLSPPMRRDRPPASSTPATGAVMGRAGGPAASRRIVVSAGLALVAAVLLGHGVRVEVVDDALLAGQRDETIALEAHSLHAALTALRKEGHHAVRPAEGGPY